MNYIVVHRSINSFIPTKLRTFADKDWDIRQPRYFCFNFIAYIEMRGCFWCSFSLASMLSITHIQKKTLEWPIRTKWASRSWDGILFWWNFPPMCFVSHLLRSFLVSSLVSIILLSRKEAETARCSTAYYRVRNQSQVAGFGVGRDVGNSHTSV